VDAWKTEAVRYREGLSLVVRYSVTAHEASTGDVRERVFYVKAYPDRDTARRMFAQIEQLARYSAASGLMGRLDGPIACLEHLRAVLLHSTAGRPLSDIMATAGDEELLAAVKDSARALARFNLSDAPTTRYFPTVEYLRSLGRPAVLLERACPEVTPDLRRILDAVRGLPVVEPRPTHRDMKPEHVLLGCDGPAFIDLDSCAAADPVLDVGLMLARFAALALADEKRSQISSMAVAFAREYFACVPGAWSDRLPVYYAASLLEVAAGLFHRQEDDWQKNVPKLIATSGRVLCDQRGLSAETIGRRTAGL
jgi:hypothetical protein